MGTRNLTIVKKNDEIKVAQYGQWDGYPEGLGVKLLNYLHNYDLDKLEEQVSKCEWYTNEELEQMWKDFIETLNPTDEQREKLNKGWMSMNESSRWGAYAPALTRDTGGTIIEYIYNGTVTKVQNSIKFIEDGLFCEYAYLIDFDERKFYVLPGFNKSKDAQFGLFAVKDPSEHGYYAPYLLAEYSLDALPSKEKFIEDCAYEEDDDDD